jgi:hypothetical protein
VPKTDAEKRGAADSAAAMAAQPAGHRKRYTSPSSSCSRTSPFTALVRALPTHGSRRGDYGKRSRQRGCTTGHRRWHETTRDNTRQHETTRDNTRQHATTRDNTRQHETTRNNTRQHETTRNNTQQHETTRDDAIQHNRRHRTAALRHRTAHPSAPRKRLKSIRTLPWTRVRTVCPWS